MFRRHRLETRGFGATQPASGGTTIKFALVSGTETMVKNGSSTSISTRHHCITCMKEYENKSLEELRMEDYMAGRKGTQQALVLLQETTCSVVRTRQHRCSESLLLQHRRSEPLRRQQRLTRLVSITRQPTSSALTRLKNPSAPTGKADELIKPTSPAAQKAIISGQNYKISPRSSNKIKMKPVESNPVDKKSLFDGLDGDFDFNDSPGLTPVSRLNPKRLIVRPKIVSELSDTQTIERTNNRLNETTVSRPIDVIFTPPDSDVEDSGPPELDGTLTEHPAKIVLRRAGYYTIPSLNELASLVAPDGSCVVDNFTVGRLNYGNVFFPESFDVAGLNLDEIDGENVDFEDLDQPPMFQFNGLGFDPARLAQAVSWYKRPDQMDTYSDVGVEFESRPDLVNDQPMSDREESISGDEIEPIYSGQIQPKTYILRHKGFGSPVPVLAKAFKSGCLVDLGIFNGASCRVGWGPKCKMMVRRNHDAAISSVAVPSLLAVSKETPSTDDSPSFLQYHKLYVENASSPVSFQADRSFAGDGAATFGDRLQTERVVRGRRVSVRETEIGSHRSSPSPIARDAFGQRLLGFLLEKRPLDLDSLRCALGQHRRLQLCNASFHIRTITGDFQLSLLINQTMSVDRVRSTIHKQLIQWQQTRGDTHVDRNRMKCLMLAAGLSVHHTSDGVLNACQDLSWLRAFALHLWYFTPMSSSVTDALDEYEKSFNGPEDENYSCQPLPLYMNQFPIESSTNKPVYDVRFHLLKLFSSKSHPLEPLLNPASFTPDALDYRLWREKYVKDLLDRHVSLDDENEEEYFLLSRLRISPKWIYEAKATKASYYKRYDDAARYLLKAEKWNECHRVIMKNISSTAIIEMNYDYLEGLLKELTVADRHKSVANWSTGGDVILEYLGVVRQVNHIVAARDPSIGYHLERLQPQLKDLCMRIMLMSAVTALDRLARSEMAKRTVDLIQNLVIAHFQDDSPRSLNALSHLMEEVPLPSDHSLVEWLELLASFKTSLYVDCPE
ncbi:unnamed protein product [Nesidiocoris tenuis]|uniref:Nuclear pore complex protein Nup98-Nup96 n=1 Tax=Nesidiocoris tenuis TaxID=355587 RepID=A0A6H5HTT7_9HEMI|nr:unnamed protein product [Nesidiocoris tenuis]